MSPGQAERRPAGDRTALVVKAGDPTATTIADPSDIDVAQPFQVMPELSAEEYAALRDDIAVSGIRVPIDVDQHGRVLDGHHRAKVCAELGIEAPVRVVQVADDAAGREHAYSVNGTRRHLDRAQRRQVAVGSLLADPGLSDRAHAARCGVSPTTVGAIRAELVATGQLSSSDSRLGTDGRSRGLPSPRERMSRERAEELTEAIGRGLDKIAGNLALLAVALRHEGVVGTDAGQVLRLALDKGCAALPPWPEPRDDPDRGPSAEDVIRRYVEPLIVAVEGVAS